MGDKKKEKQKERKCFRCKQKASKEKEVYIKCNFAHFISMIHKKKNVPTAKFVFHGIRYSIASIL